MSGLAGLHGLQQYAIKQEPSWSYSAFIKVASWLCGNTDKLFTLAEPATACDLHLGKLQSLFRNVPIRSRKTSRQGVAGNYWPRDEVLQLLQIHGVVSLQTDGSFKLNPMITGDFAADQARFCVYPLNNTRAELPTVPDHNLIYVPSFSIRPYKAGEQQYYEELWANRSWGKYSNCSFSFYSSFIVAQAIVENVAHEQHTAEIQGRVDPCWIFSGGLDKKGYAHINNPWLKSVLPESGILAQDLPSTGAARLVAMVNNPTLPWVDGRDWNRCTQEEKGLEAHHVCLKRSCVNPFHVHPMKIKDHKKVHSYLDDHTEQHITAAVKAAWTAANDNDSNKNDNQERISQ